jgi:hypothetical protein
MQIICMVACLKQDPHSRQSRASEDGRGSSLCANPGETGFHLCLSDAPMLAKFGKSVLSHYIISGEYPTSLYPRHLF